MGWTHQRRVHSSRRGHRIRHLSDNSYSHIPIPESSPSHLSNHLRTPHSVDWECSSHPDILQTRPMLQDYIYGFHRSYIHFWFRILRIRRIFITLYRVHQYHNMLQVCVILYLNVKRNTFSFANQSSFMAVSATLSAFTVATYITSLAIIQVGNSLTYLIASNFTLYGTSYLGSCRASFLASAFYHVSWS